MWVFNSYDWFNDISQRNDVDWKIFYEMLLYTCENNVEKTIAYIHVNTQMIFKNVNVVIWCLYHEFIYNHLIQDFWW